MKVRLKMGNKFSRTFNSHYGISWENSRTVCYRIYLNRKFTAILIYYFLPFVGIKKTNISIVLIIIFRKVQFLLGNSDGSNIFELFAYSINN